MIGKRDVRCEDLGPDKRRVVVDATGVGMPVVEMLREARPDIVLCVGQAGGRTDLCLERVGINVQDARIRMSFRYCGEPADNWALVGIVLGISNGNKRFHTRASGGVPSWPLKPASKLLVVCWYESWS